MGRVITMSAMLLVSSVARAQVPCEARIVPHAGTCMAPVVDVRELAAALAVEVPKVDGAPDVAMTVDAEPCASNAVRVVLTFEGPRGAAPTRRSIELRDVPAEARVRVVALAIAEMQRASCAPSPAPPALPEPVPEAPPSTAPAGVEPTRAVAEPARRFAPRKPAPPLRGDASLSTVGWMFPASTASLFGGQADLRAVWSAAPWLRAGLSGFAATGSTRDPLGDVTLTVLGGGLFVGLTSTGGPIDVSIGPRLSLAGARARGTAASPGVFESWGNTLLVLLGAEAQVRAPLHAGVSAFTTIGVGETLRGLRAHADARTPSGLTGAMAVASVGLSLDL